jgi:hypothetical protein
VYAGSSGRLLDGPFWFTSQQSTVTLAKLRKLRVCGKRIASINYVGNANDDLCDMR